MKQNVSFGNFALTIGIDVCTGLPFSTVPEVPDGRHAALFPVVTNYCYITLLI